MHQPRRGLIQMRRGLWPVMVAAVVVGGATGALVPVQAPAQVQDLAHPGLSCDAADGVAQIHSHRLCLALDAALAEHFAHQNADRGVDQGRVPPGLILRATVTGASAQHVAARLSWSGHHTGNNQSGNTPILETRIIDSGLRSSVYTSLSKVLISVAQL